MVVAGDIAYCSYIHATTYTLLSPVPGPLLRPMIVQFLVSMQFVAVRPEVSVYSRVYFCTRPKIHGSHRELSLLHVCMTA
jgi:hypothetical protein